MESSLREVPLYGEVGKIGGGRTQQGSKREWRGGRGRQGRCKEDVEDGEDESLQNTYVEERV
jgi:hypothetical protein